MTYYIHINRGVIDSNRTRNLDNPPITFRKGKYGKSVYAHEIEFPAGGRVISSTGHEPPILPCGARVVIVTEVEPKVIR